MMQQTIDVISKVIHAKYKSSQLTKKDIANKTGLALNTINNAITGKNMTLSSMLQIMDVLGMNLKDLIMEAEKMGLTFPKPCTQSKHVNVDEVTKATAEGQSTMQVAARMGIEEDQLKDIVSAATHPAEEMFEIK
jgi:hypothetical protein